ncbi:MAG: hypothetical protein OCU22_07730 [Canidatus Methanoxibalbensis ujae]|nr:hypothetical protein [Candidatus Methanoxibalbensis ujae]
MKVIMMSVDIAYRTLYDLTTRLGVTVLGIYFQSYIEEREIGFAYRLIDDFITEFKIIRGTIDYVEIPDSFFMDYGIKALWHTHIYGHIHNDSESIMFEDSISSIDKAFLLEKAIFNLDGIGVIYLSNEGVKAEYYEIFPKCIKISQLMRKEMLNILRLKDEIDTLIQQGRYDEADKLKTEMSKLLFEYKNKLFTHAEGCIYKAFEETASFPSHLLRRTLIKIMREEVIY